MSSYCQNSDMVACRNYYYTGEVKGADPNLDTQTAQNFGWDSTKLAQLGSAALKTGRSQPLAPASPSDVGHTLLDLLGLIPVAGEPADALNCGWYGAEGQTTSAALSCGAAVPFAGWLA